MSQVKASLYSNSQNDSVGGIIPRLCDNQNLGDIDSRCPLFIKLEFWKTRGLPDSLEQIFIDFMQPTVLVTGMLKIS